MRLLFIVTSFICVLITISCNSSTQSGQKPTQQVSTNPYFIKYKGGYIIEVKGVSNQSDGEIYVLHRNGNAKWMWIRVQPDNQTKILSEKTGTWVASENKITITIKGNTGDIVETYNLVNGKFVFGDRSLKKTE